MIRAIQHQYGLTCREAGLAKKQGKLPHYFVTEVIENFKQSAVLQVRRALQFFFSASRHNEVHHIVLAGGTAAIPGLASLIQEQVGIPTTVANPFANMEISPRVDATLLAQDASALMICCGLAMRSLEQ